MKRGRIARWLSENVVTATVLALSPIVLGAGRVGALLAGAPRPAAQTAQSPLPLPDAPSSTAATVARAALEESVRADDEVVELYAAGDLLGALEAARSRGLTARVTAMEELERLYNQSRSFRSEGQRAEFIATLKAAIELDSSLAPEGSTLGAGFRRQLSRALTTQGYKELRRKRYDEAESAFTEAIELDPKSRLAAKGLKATLRKGGQRR